MDIGKEIRILEVKPEPLMLPQVVPVEPTREPVPV